MNKTYRAMQVSAPGTLELVHKPRPQAGRGEVLIAVEACGVCGADRGDIERPAALGRVPGHEVVGRIVELGADVPPLWSLGQRVGVGRLGGHCLHCEQCRRGAFQLCHHQSFGGSDRDGGYAEMMLASHTGLVAIPAAFESAAAAPILCAGVATFNALRHSGAQPGDLVVVQGIGGLGHMAVQYGQRMGLRVVAVGRGPGLAADARALGAHHVIDASVEDPADAVLRLGGAQAIVTTIGDAAAVSALLRCLRAQGRLVLLGAGREPLTVAAGQLVIGERVLQGSITGTPSDSERALDFSLLTGALPRIETLPLLQAAEAYRRLQAGSIHHRLVLTMDPAP